MTNCNIIGNCKIDEKNFTNDKKKKIKFKYKCSLLNGISETASCGKPGHYDNITLISKNYVMYKNKLYDLMYACECLTCGGGPGRGCLYIGKWNDGIV
jgi:hypothetical protein